MLQQRPGSAFFLTMYPSWGNFGAPQSQNYGGSGPRKPPTGSHTGQAAGFGGFEASSSGSLFSSLQEQHLQQMQQLQMLHQKQLQSVLHHGSSAAAPPPPPAYGAGHSGGYMGSSWHSEGSAHVDTGAGAQSYFKQEQTPAPPTREPPAPKQGVPPSAGASPAPKQGHQQPPPPPPQPHPVENQPIPPPPEPQPSKPPENNGVPKEVMKKESSSTEDEKSLPLQVKPGVELVLKYCE